MLLAGPIFHTGINTWILSKFVNVLLDSSTFYYILLILVGAELPLCIVNIVVTLS